MIIISFIQDSAGFSEGGGRRESAVSQSYQGVKSGILTATKCNLFGGEGTMEGAAYSAPPSPL